MNEPLDTPITSVVASFDRQAFDYDARVGLPATTGAAVAQAIVDSAGANTDDLVVELGAGTGEIGAHLSRLPVRYIGLDNSRAMLDAFRAKVDFGAPSLIVADCDHSWPLPDGSAAVVFASRVIHLLAPEHVATEAVRISRSGAVLVLGRVLRERDSIKERLRRQRQQLLAGAGITPRQGEEGTRRVVERCVTAGGESLGRSVVVEWAGETTPAEVIASWETLSRMGSVLVDPVTRADILDRLRRWARTEFGNLDRLEVSRERYAIDVIRLP